MEQEQTNIVAYIFVRDAHEDDFDRIFALPARDERRFHSAARLIGPWDALVVATVDDLRELEEIILDDVRGGHSPADNTALALGTVRPPGLVTWTASPPVIAFARIRVAPGSADRVMADLAAHPNALGIVAVAGSYDILYEFGGETFQEVANLLTDVIARTRGIAWSETSFATGLFGSAGKHSAP